VTPRRHDRNMAICSFCNREMTDTVSCTVEVLHRRGVPVPQIPYGAEHHSRSWGPRARRCGDCGTPLGGFHHLGCDMQVCAVCGRQMISCGCRFDEDPPELFEDDDEEDDDEWRSQIDRVVSLLPRLAERARPDDSA
jgi:hypothetical protein